ncbi:hypothetical protein ACIQNT_32550 [Streptomyces luteogriseus]|uniref:hypothetical protein n=1 Tax=Streptomyces luteogriseus TaxID=68233 RepID=UPI0037F9379B
MTSGIRITWTLGAHGWAECTLEDHQAKAELTASYITSAPEEFLTGVARLVAGETETCAQFEAEPTAYRWIFHRHGEDVRVRMLELRDGSDHDTRGTARCRRAPHGGHVSFGSGGQPSGRLIGLVCGTGNSAVLFSQE